MVKKQHWCVIYPNSCYNEMCYKGTAVCFLTQVSHHVSFKAPESVFCGCFWRRGVGCGGVGRGLI